jgi:HTH-type transcriptional regulator/antitoxin HipB
VTGHEQPHQDCLGNRLFFNDYPFAVAFAERGKKKSRTGPIFVFPLNNPVRYDHVTKAGFFPSGSGAMNSQAIRSTGELGRAIRLRRKALGLTQAGVAQVAGVGSRFVSEVERGKSTAEFGKVLRLVSVLGLDIQVAFRPGALP